MTPAKTSGSTTDTIFVMTVPTQVANVNTSPMKATVSGDRAIEFTGLVGDLGKRIDGISTQSFQRGRS